jgi:hypothetical protein
MKLYDPRYPEGEKLVVQPFTAWLQTLAFAFILGVTVGIFATQIIQAYRA